MSIRLDIRAGDFAQRFRAFLDTKRETAADVEAAARALRIPDAGHMLPYEQPEALADAILIDPRATHCARTPSP